MGVPSMPGHMPDKGIPHKHWRNILRPLGWEMLLSGHIHYIYDHDNHSNHNDNYYNHDDDLAHWTM